MTPPFTFDELLRVFSHVASTVEAEAMARSAFAEGTLSPEHRGTNGLTFRVRSNVALTEDTLILLSLESKALEGRVDEYRRTLRAGRPETQREAREWAQRRAELKTWADAGYPGSKGQPR